MQRLQCIEYNAQSTTHRIQCIENIAMHILQLTKLLFSIQMKKLGFHCLIEGVSFFQEKSNQNKLWLSCAKLILIQASQPAHFSFYFSAYIAFFSYSLRLVIKAISIVQNNYLLFCQKLAIFQLQKKLWPSSIFNKSRSSSIKKNQVIFYFQIN